MGKAFEALKKIDEKLGPASKALLETPGGKKAAERVDEFRRKAETINKQLEEGGLDSLAAASEGINELMQSEEGEKAMGIFQELHLKGVMKTAEFFHGNPKITKNIQKVWAKLPEVAKDGLLASRFVNIPGYSAVGKLLNNAAHLGVIERREEDLAAMAKNDNAAANAAVALATALGVGGVVAPAAEWAKAYDKMAYENYAVARRHMKELESEDAEKARQHAKYEKLKTADVGDSAARVEAIKKKIKSGRTSNRNEAAN